MTDARSQELLEFPLVRARLAAHTAFAPSRRLAEALTPSSDPIVVKRMLDETDQARDLLARRPDVGVGGAHDIGQLVLRARRGGRLDGNELLEIMDTLVAAGRLSDALRDERPPLLHELGRSIKPLPVLRARLEQSLDPAGVLLDSASPALGGLRRAVRVAYERLRDAARDDRPQQRYRCGAAGADRHAAQRPLRGARPRRRAWPREGHRPRPVGEWPDAVHRAARRRRAGQHLARGAAHRAGRRGAHPRRAVRPRRGPGRGARRDARRAGHVRLLDRPGPAGRRDGRGPAGNGGARRRRAAHRAAPGSDRPRRADRHPAWHRLPRAGHHRARTPAARPWRCALSACSR